MKGIKKNLKWIIGACLIPILLFLLSLLYNKKNDSQTNNIKENRGTVAKEIGTQNNYYGDSASKKNELKQESKENKIENIKSPNSNNIIGNGNSIKH